MIFATLLLWSSLSTASDRLSSHIEVIERPLASDVVFGWSIQALGSYLLINGTHEGTECQPNFSAYCPAFFIYERQGDHWQFTQAVRTSDAGLGYPLWHDENTILYRLNREFGGKRNEVETYVYTRNLTTNEFEPSPPILHLDPQAMTIFDGKLVVISSETIVYWELQGDDWVASAPLYLSAIHPSPDKLNVSGAFIRGDYAYFMIDNALVTFNLATSTFTDHYDFSVEGIIPTYFWLMSNGLAVVPQSPSSLVYEPLRLYDSVGGTWQHLLNIDTPRDWGKASRLGADESSIFTRRETRLAGEDVDVVTFFRELQPGTWSEAGHILIPEEGEFVQYVTSIAVSGRGLVIADGVHTITDGRVLYLPDYEYYLDLDGDILPAGWEMEFGYSPDAFDDFDADSDNDGLSGIEEYMHMTSPLNDDTDDDGMPDGWEVQSFLDPLDAGDASLDFDNDGVSNLQEFIDRTNPTDRNSFLARSQPKAPKNGGGGGGAISVWALMILFGQILSNLVAPRRSRLPSDTPNKNGPYGAVYDWRARED